VPGIPSDQPGTTSGQERGAPGKGSVPERIRVTNGYVTPWHLADSGAGAAEQLEELPRRGQDNRGLEQQVPAVPDGVSGSGAVT
jgi:hypothetical protein